MRRKQRVGERERERERERESGLAGRLTTTLHDSSIPVIRIAPLSERIPLERPGRPSCGFRLRGRCRVPTILCFARWDGGCKGRRELEPARSRLEGRVEGREGGDAKELENVSRG